MIGVHLKRFKKNDRGASAVEFALILPILVFLVMGILEFGWLFNGWIAVRGAAREGARVAVAVKETGDTGYINDAVEMHIENSGIPNISVAGVHTEMHITQGNINNPQEFGLKVRVTGEMTPLVRYYVGRNGEDVTIVGEATMRIE